MTRLTSSYVGGPLDAVASTRVSEPLREARESEEQEWLERRAQRQERRRQRAAGSRSSRRRDRDADQTRESRRDSSSERMRDDARTSDRRTVGREARRPLGPSFTPISFEPSWPAAEQVSAHMGESTAGEVTRRGERRARPELRLVPLQPSPYASGRRNSFDGYDDFDSYDDYDSFDGHDAFDYDDPADFDEGLPYGDLSERRASRRARRASQQFRPQPSRAEEPSYEVRSAFYTEEDYREQRGLPGSESRRRAVREALVNIPRVVGSAAVRALGHMHFLVVAGLIVATLVLLYGPVRDLYIANRRLAVLQATYEALLVENDSIRGELEALQTREGIENEARERGFVQAGETKVIVEGLPEELQAQDGAVAAVADIEVPDEQPWYIQVLDKVFAYEGG